MPRPRSGGDAEVPKLLDKALRVLESFDAERPMRSEASLHHELAIPSTTLNRILRSLEATGYLMRYEDGRYQLGAAAVRLGRRAERSLNLGTYLRPILHELWGEVDELTLLAVPEFRSGHARYIAALESSSQVRVIGEVGDRLPLTAGATARTLLAFQSEDRIEAALTRPLPRLATGTLTEPNTVRQQLSLLREQGWGFSWEETYDGAWAIAAPVLDDAHHYAIASIGVAVPTGRHSEVFAQRIRVAVCAAAEQATALIGGAPLESLIERH